MQKIFLKKEEFGDTENMISVVQFGCTDLPPWLNECFYYVKMNVFIIHSSLLFGYT